MAQSAFPSSVHPLARLAPGTSILVRACAASGVLRATSTACHLQIGGNLGPMIGSGKSCLPVLPPPERAVSCHHLSMSRSIGFVPTRFCLRPGANGANGSCSCRAVRVPARLRVCDRMFVVHVSLTRQIGFPTSLDLLPDRDAKYFLAYSTLWKSKQEAQDTHCPVAEGGALYHLHQPTRTHPQPPSSKKVCGVRLCGVPGLMTSVFDPLESLPAVCQRQTTSLFGPHYTRAHTHKTRRKSQTISSFYGDLVVFLINFPVRLCGPFLSKHLVVFAVC